VTVERVYTFAALRDEALRRGDPALAAYIAGMEVAAAQGLGAKVARPPDSRPVGLEQVQSLRRPVALPMAARLAAGEYVTRGPVSDANRTTLRTATGRACEQDATPRAAH
jgi:hypothetical protein